VIVELKPARSGTALRVVDDGCGIRGRTRDAGGAGFGLRSMRDRTAGLGGHLDVRETTTGGTEIEAVFP
jgi:signal transduction histidine kinase